MKTFRFRAICEDHIVWDPVGIAEFSRKYTANVHESLAEIRRRVEALVDKHDERRDGFVEVIRKAMTTKLADNTDEVLKVLTKHGITHALAKEATEIARVQGGFTIFAVVDALTRLAGRLQSAGDRPEADGRASSLLALAVAEV